MDDYPNLMPMGYNCATNQTQTVGDLCRQLDYELSNNKSIRWKLNLNEGVGMT